MTLTASCPVAVATRADFKAARRDRSGDWIARKERVDDSAALARLAHRRSAH